MTIILTTSLITVLLALFFYKPIHRYRYYLYAFFGLVVLVLSEAEANIVSLGYVTLGMFLVVMYTGVLNRGRFRKRLSAVRAELSVIASLFLLPHALAFLEYLLEDVGVFSGTLSYYLGLLAFLLMIPLTLTSFMVIRKKIGHRRWKGLHRFAYLFYALVAFHLITIQNDRMYFYIAIFGVYALLRTHMAVFQSIKQAKKKKRMGSF